MKLFSVQSSSCFIQLQIPLRVVYIISNDNDCWKYEVKFRYLLFILSSLTVLECLNIIFPDYSTGGYGFGHIYANLFLTIITARGSENK